MLFRSAVLAEEGFAAKGERGNTPVACLAVGLLVSDDFRFEPFRVPGNLPVQCRKVEAGARGVMRGATLGLSDAAVAAFGSPGERQLARDLRHKYSTTSAVGEIAGALLTAIPSGGTSLEVAGARAVGKQAVERPAVGMRRRKNAFVDCIVGDGPGLSGPVGQFRGQAASLALDVRRVEAGTQRRLGQKLERFLEVLRQRPQRDGAGFHAGVGGERRAEQIEAPRQRERFGAARRNEWRSQ